MKNVIYLILTTFIICPFIFSCENGTVDPQQLTVNGQIIKHTSCKDFFKSATLITPDSLSCVDYSFETNNKLILKHINAGFNCCPEKLWCEVSLVDDTIIIQEFERNALCDCDCLYDLDIEVTGVHKKKYLMKFVEPYIRDQEKLIFEIDLTNETEGFFCVARKRYPWGIYSMNQ
jgi:hypothetical protein